MARKILLADDSVTAQNMGRKILADAGYDISTVNNGSAALKRINETLPDMVILDVYMPGYSGLEVCERLKESSATAHIPVLLTVGKLEPFKPDEASRVRADAYIVKPFEASELLSAVAHLEDIAAAATPPQPTAQRAGKNSVGKTAAKSEPERSWKRSFGAPAPAKSMVALKSAFHDFRRAKENQPAKPPALEVQPLPMEEAPVIPELPRDITPDELDVLSAVAARLDSAAPSQAEPPVAATAPAAAQTAAPDETPNPPTSIQELTQVTAARFLQEPAPIDKADEPLFAVALAAQQEETAQESAKSNSEAMAVIDAAPAATQSVAAAAGAAAGAAAFEIAIAHVPQPAEPELGHVGNPSQQATSRGVEELKSEVSVAETLEPSNTPVASAATMEPAPVAPELAEPNTIAATATTELEELEGPPPSEEEIAEALRLLTPANGSSQSSPTAQESGEITSSAAQTASTTASSPRWIAEPMAVTPEEASQSLEAEMFGAALADAVREIAFVPAGCEASSGEPAVQPPAGEVPSQSSTEAPAAVQESASQFADSTAPQTTPAVEENVSPVASAEPVPEQTPLATYADMPSPEQAEITTVAAAGESTIAQQAIELALAAHATAGTDTDHPEAPKAMAAAATADGVPAAGPDAATIASIVESVLADLRPRIVEEITKKLAGR